MVYLIEMNLTYLALKGLKEIIDNKLSINKVTNHFKMEYNFSKEDYEILSKIINGTIRRFYLLRLQALEAYPNFEEDDDEIYLLSLVIYQLIYLKKSIANFKVIEKAIDTVKLCNLRFDLEDLKNKLETISKTKFNFSKEITKDFYSYQSYMFSTPLWLIKMWSKQYGDDVLINLLHANQVKPLVYVKQNHLKITEEELLKEKIYNKVNILKEAFVYLSNVSLSLTDDYKKGYVFKQDLSYQLVCNSIDLIPHAKVLHLNGNTASFSSNLAIRLKQVNGNIITTFEKSDLYRKALYMYQRLSLDNAKAFFSSTFDLKNKINEKFDVVICSPNSSSLGQVNSKNSILLTLKENEISQFILNEKKTLKEANLYLNKFGKLLYVVNTINLDETVNVISDFIKNNPNYHLIDQRQIFPYEFNSYGVYYAILGKD